MMRALHTAASGMYAQQLNIDTISNNLANVNTTGFKRSRVEFQDLIYQSLQATGSVRNLNTVVPNELRVGHGVKSVGIEKMHSQGAPAVTNNPLDLLIEGEGFFKLRRADDSIAYTRDGSFKRSPDGRIVNSDGYSLDPDLTIPEDTLDISVSPDGLVEVRVVGSNNLDEIGQVELVRFSNPEGLRPIGKNLYIETDASGQPILGIADAEGFGAIQQGFLESSNVSVVEEMVGLIVAQRAYEINSKAIRTAEELLSLANNLKR